MADNNINEQVQQLEKIWRKYSMNSDQNLLYFARRMVKVYSEMELLTEKEVSNTANMTDVQIIDFLASKKLLTLATREQEQEFCDRFIGNVEEWDNDADRNLIPPYFWCRAYERVRELVKKDASQQERLDKIGARVDTFARNLNASGGLIVDGQNNILSGAPLHFVDVENIADVFEGFKKMLDARRADVDDGMREVYDGAYKKLDDAIKAYDELYGMGDLSESKVGAIADRYEDWVRVADQAQLTDETYKEISGVKFLDNKGEIEPQFENPDDKVEHVEWQPGDRLIRGRRGDTLLNITRVEYAKRNLARTDKNIDADEAENEINELMVEKVYEILSAEKLLAFNEGKYKPTDEEQIAIANKAKADLVAKGATEEEAEKIVNENLEEVFVKQVERQRYVDSLAQKTGTVSDPAYQRVVDKDVNSLAGYFTRFKSKVGNGFKKLGNAVSGLFNRLKPHDKLAAARTTTGSYQSKREKRIELFVRVLKGFGAAFLASALITVIGSAAAAVAGVSLAAGLAMVGVIASIVMSVIQIHKWRKARLDNGLTAEFKDMIQDKDLLASLGVSGLAATAMVFAGFNMPAAAAAFGYSALAAATGKNAIESFKDARQKFGVTESIIWSIFNAGAVVAGGIAGRAVGHNVVDALFDHKPELVGQKTEKTVTEEVKHDETHRVYPADDTAEKAVISWNADNPELLQQRIEAIEAYNAEHGTNLDPYRILRVHALAGGDIYNHNDYHFQNGPDIKMSHMTGYGPAHMQNYGYTPEEVDIVKHLFEPGSAELNESSMSTAAKFDLGLSNKGYIGYVDGVSDHQNNLAVQTDLDKSGFSVSHHLPDGTPAHSLYANAGEFPHDVTETVTDTVSHTETSWDKLLNNLMASYGIYNKPNANIDLVDRLGAKPGIIEKETQSREIRDPEQTPVSPNTSSQGEGQGNTPKDEGSSNNPQNAVVVAGPKEIVSKEDEQNENKTFGMTIKQAKAYRDLQGTLQTKLDKKAKTQSNKYDADIANLTYEINKMRNRLGKPTDEELENAIAAASIRKKIKALQAKIEDFKNTWSEKTTTARDNKALEIAKLEAEIETLGGEKMLDTSKQVYYKPITGETRNKEEKNGKTAKEFDEKGRKISENNIARVVAGSLSELEALEKEEEEKEEQRKQQKKQQQKQQKQQEEQQKKLQKLIEESKRLAEMQNNIQEQIAILNSSQHNNAA